MARHPKFEDYTKRKFAPGVGTGRRGVGNRPPHAADEAAAISRKRRRTRALELRSQHASYSQIAGELGISFHQAREDVKRAISECGYEQREEARALLNAQHDADLLRLSAAIRALLPLAVPEAGRPDIRAAQALANLTRSKTRIAIAKAALNCADLEPMAKPEQNLNLNVSVQTVSIEAAMRVADENSSVGACEVPVERRIQ